MTSASVELPPAEPSASALSATRSMCCWALVAVAGSFVISALIARAAVAGELGVVLAVLPYLMLMVGLWWLTRGNVVVVVLAAYLVGPAPADNLLPQVFIFPHSDYALRARDMFFLADLVLLCAVLMLAWHLWFLKSLSVKSESVKSRSMGLPENSAVPAAPDRRWVAWWCGGLTVLAVYPVLIGIWFGAGQSVAAALQGATMPLRAVIIAGLVVLWVRLHGWEAAVRSTARTVIVAGTLLAIAAVAALFVAQVLAPGQPQFFVFGYPLVVDHRPGLPGWGNNILSNYLCVCVVAAVLLRQHIRWRLGWVVVVIAVLLLGLVFTESRVALLASLIAVFTPIVVSVLRRIRPWRGTLPAIAVAGSVAVLLCVVTAVALPILNPRFNTLTPGVLAHQLPRASDPNYATEHRSSGPESGASVGGESFSTRGGLVQAATAIWQRAPIVGSGWNSWGWAKMQENPRLVVAVDPHNGLLWLLAETGALGVLLLYAIPIALAVRRPRLAWLWAVPAVATLLELVNPNVRNGHFAVVVWAFAALAMTAPRAGRSAEDLRLAAAQR